MHMDLISASMGNSSATMGNETDTVYNEDDLGIDWNGTLDFDDLLQKEKDSDFDIGVKYGFYILSFVVAFLGNLCIIVVILRTKSLRTKFNMYIVNLAVADFLMPSVCMWISLVNSSGDQWVIGGFLCKIHTFVQVTIVCSSVFTLTTVTLDRYLATAYPRAVWITQKCQPLAIAIIWICAISIAIPWIIYQFYAEFDWIGGHEVVCQSRFASLQARRAYYVAFFVIVFIVPLLLMFTLIVITIIKGDTVPRNTSIEIENYQDMRRRAVYMVLTVIIVFCVCWTPQQSLLIWDVYRERFKKQPHMKQLHYITLYMAYTSSAVNPVIYYLYNKCFRHALWALLKTRCKGENSEMSVAPETSPDVLDMSVTASAAGHSEQGGTEDEIDDSSLTTVSLSE